jgi:anti-anti-sigma regulatory factor
MFRISIIEMPLERRLVVEGNLTTPWVAELRRTWLEAAGSLEGRKVVIDLTAATMIDPEGEAAIHELMQQGAKFCCSGVFNRHVVQRVAQRCHARLRNVLDRKHSKE